MKKRFRVGFTLIELLVVIAIIAVLIALLLAGRPGGPRGRPAGAVRQQPEADRPRAAQLSRHLGTFPHGLGPGRHAQWTTYRRPFLASLMPFIEQQNLFNSYNYDLSFEQPANITTRATIISTFTCPTDQQQIFVNNAGTVTDVKGSYGVNWGQNVYANQVLAAPFGLNYGATARGDPRRDEPDVPDGRVDSRRPTRPVSRSP